MAVRIDVKVDPGSQAAIEEFLHAYPTKAPQAVARAINHTARKVRTQVKKSITDILNIAKSDLGGQHWFGGIAVVDAKPDKLEATVLVTGKRIPLIEFGARQQVVRGTAQAKLLGRKYKSVGRSGAGTEYAIRRGLPKLASGAFIVTLKTGHIGVFMRKDKWLTTPVTR